MWHVLYYLYYDYAVSLTTLSVQLHMSYTQHETNSMAKCVHPNTVVKLKAKAFLYLPGMDSTNTLQHTRLP